jgi:hypothetical protein
MISNWVPVVALFGVVFSIVAVLAFAIRGKFEGSTKKGVASVLGIFAGVGGASHGPGEMLQSNIAPSGIMIQAWPDLTLLGGEPAMTIVPSYLVTGVLTIIVGLVVTIWAATSIDRRNGGLILIMLSILLLLVGGGIIPPIPGVIAGIISTRSRRFWSSGLASGAHP